MTTPPPPPPPSVPEQGPSNSGSDDKTMALISHFGMVLFGFWPALIIYLVKGKDSEYVKAESAKAFNFAIIPSAISMVLGFLYNTGAFYSTNSLGLDSWGIMTCFFCGITAVLWLGVAIFGIMNGIKANDGKATKYPFEIPILK